MSKRPGFEMEDFDTLFGGADVEDTTGIFSNVHTKEAYPIKEISLKELHAFKSHPFQVNDDQAMEDLAESIKENGVLHPALVREDPNGGYEIISGHRRHRACQLAGLTHIPARVLDLDDDAATVCMTDANFYQRDSILPSEKAKAYRMKNDAIKHRGTRGGGKSVDEIGEAAGESGKTVQRFIRMSYLTDDFLAMVDNKKLSIVQAVNISQIDIEKQKLLYKVVEHSKAKITREQSVSLLESYREGILDESRMLLILTNRKLKKRKVVLKEELLNRYFSIFMSDDEIEKYIIEAIEAMKAGESNV